MIKAVGDVDQSGSQHVLLSTLALAMSTYDMVDADRSSLCSLQTCGHRHAAAPPAAQHGSGLCRVAAICCSQERLEVHRCQAGAPDQAQCPEASLGCMVAGMSTAAGQAVCSQATAAAEHSWKSLAVLEGAPTLLDVCT